jgi:Fe-S-cluster containining protein
MTELISVSLLRMQYVLPSRQLAQYSQRELIGIEIKPEAHGLPWWQAEQHILLRFAPTASFLNPSAHQLAIIERVPDDRAVAAKTCASCGQCCTRLPDHQIAIYMSRYERAHAEMAGYRIWEGVAGNIQVQNALFDVLKTKENGDCHFLGPDGCTLGEYKPLWCKMYYCEKLYGGTYPFETVVPAPVLPSVRRSETTPPDSPLG